MRSGNMLSSLNEVTSAAKLEGLSRVTDSESYIKCEKGEFNWPTSPRYIAFPHRLTPSTVTSHLLWSPSYEWSGLFSLCGSEEKENREVAWRRKQGRRNISVHRINNSDLDWKTIRWNDQIELNYLTDKNEEVMIFKATDLIAAFGLLAEIWGTDKAVISGATDEWLALEWIPRELITLHQRVS